MNRELRRDADARLEPCAHTPFRRVSFLNLALFLGAE